MVAKLYELASRGERKAGVRVGVHATWDPYFYLVRVGAAAIRGRVDLILHIFEVSRGHCEERVVALGQTVAAVLPLDIDLGAALGEGDLRTGAVRRGSKRH